MSNDTKKRQDTKITKNISNILREVFYCAEDLFEQPANKATQFINSY